MDSKKKKTEAHFLRNQLFENLQDSCKIILKLIDLDLSPKELQYISDYSDGVYKLMLYWEGEGYISDRDKK